MQYTRQVQYLHSQLAPAVPIDSFIDAIKPAALGLTDKSQFYAPVRFAVQICGGINAPAGAIRVDVPIHANERWLDDMKKRFAGMIGLKNSLQGSDISFRTIAGQDISTIDQQHLPRVGKLNVYVGDKKIRLPAMPAIPVEYSVCKEANIQAWLQQVSSELPELIAKELVAQKNLTQLDAAVRGDGPVLKLIQKHLVESSPAAPKGGGGGKNVSGVPSAPEGGGWNEFLRTHHMNSPDRIGQSEAQATLVSVSKDMLSNLRRFIEAAAEPIGSYISHLDAKRIASDLSKRSGEDVDHYKPLLASAAPGGAGSGNIDGHELYRKIAEDALASPFVQQAIIATVYTRPLEAGCRWSFDDEKKLRSKTEKGKTLTQREKDALTRAVKDTEKKVQEAKSEAERQRLLKQLADERAKEKAAAARVAQQEAEYDKYMMTPGNFGPNPDDFLMSRGDKVNLGNITAYVKAAGKSGLQQRKLESLQIIARRFNIPLNQGLASYVGFGSKGKDQLVDEIIAYVTGLSKKPTEPVVKQEEVPEAKAQPDVEEASSSSSDSEADVENVKTSKDEVSENDASDLSDSEPEKDIPVVENRWSGISEAKKFLNDNVVNLTRQDIDDYETQFLDNAGRWNPRNLRRDVLYRIVQLILPETDTSKRVNDTGQELSKTIVDFYEAVRKNRKEDLNAQIGAHHPWNAQIHHTLQPLADGAYPTYYNLLHTKQDMTKDAAFAGNVVETYKAYHMFSGLPISPPGLVVEPISKRAAAAARGGSKKKQSGKWNSSKDEDNKFHRMKSEMPPLIPLGDYAAFDPIECGSCGGGGGQSSDEDDEKVSSFIKGSLPPLERIDCGMSSDDDDEADKKKTKNVKSRIGSSIAPPVVPLAAGGIPPRPPLVRLSDVQAKIRSRLVPISDDMQDIESSDSMANEDIGDAYNLPGCNDVFGPDF